MSDHPYDAEAETVAGDTPAADDSGGRAPLASTAVGAFEQDEKTVISARTPMPLSVVPPGLHPRELGQLLVGQRLDDLWLEEYVGGGGMGAVFRAVDTRLQRNVAVKVLSTLQTDGIDTARRFEVEAQSAARLDHPNIARVYYVGEDRGVAYIVFEYIEGINLRDAIAQGGPLPVAEAIDYTVQIADALLHAWQRNVVHRDIKPSNILIASDGRAKLVDMGLARLHQVEHADGELTSSGMTLGTFDYISPEQARNPKDADTRSDIYSLGCTLYFILTGQPPFSGGTALQKLLQHQGEAPPAIAELRPDVPQPIVDVLDTMLAKRIDQRYQNPAELLTALTDAADQLGIGHAPVTVAQVWSAPRSKGSWLRRHATWAVPVALLLLGVVGIEYWLGGQDEPPRFMEETLPAADSPAIDGAIPAPMISPATGDGDAADDDSTVVPRLPGE
jgi:serine/threonine-protein kinase